MIMTEASARVAKDACKFYEKSLKLILKHLPGVTCDEGLGKHVVLMFSSEDDYYQYIMYFYGDGEHPMSSGVCLSGDGYVHYAFPVDDENPSGYRATLVHELTHGCLNHLPIPLWLNEAIAMRMEDALCSSQPIQIDKYILKQHHDHWNAKTIQDFWSGESWNQVGDSFGLSYALAQIIWRKIEVDLRAPQKMIVDFILSASYEDAGESACQRVFELSMGDFVEDFLGEGNWTPLPGDQLFPEPAPQDPL